MNNFWSDLTANTVITASITFLAFILGFIIQQQIEKRKERQRLSKLERYFYTGIEYIRAAVIEQIQFYSELSRNMNDLNQHQYTYLERTRLYLENIKFIADLDFYDIFITNKSSKKFPEKLKYFHHLNNSILYIPHQNKSSKESFEKFQNKVTKLESQWFDSTNILINTVERLIIISPSEKKIKMMYNEIKRLYDECSLNQQLSETQSFHDKFIQPLNAICFANVQTDAYNQLMPILRKLSLLYAEIISLRQFYSVKFKSDAKKLESKLAILDDAVRYFNHKIDLDTSLNII